MNENTEFYEFKGKHGCTKCKAKILYNATVIAYECNAKHCKFILCPKCQKNDINNCYWREKSTTSQLQNSKLQ